MNCKNQKNEESEGSPNGNAVLENKIPSDNVSAPPPTTEVAVASCPGASASIPSPSSVDSGMTSSECIPLSHVSPGASQLKNCEAPLAYEGETEEAKEPADSERSIVPRSTISTFGIRRIRSLDPTTAVHVDDADESVGGDAENITGAVFDSESESEDGSKASHTGHVQTVEDLMQMIGREPTTEAVQGIPPLRLTPESYSEFRSEIKGGESRLRHLESIVSAPIYPVISGDKNILSSACTLPSDEGFIRTLRIGGGLVPTFAIAPRKGSDGLNFAIYYVPTSLSELTSKIAGVYARGARFRLPDGHMAYFTMDRKVVLVKTQRRRSYFIAPDVCELLPAGAVLVPCDLTYEDLEDTERFEQVISPLTEPELLNRMCATFSKKCPEVLQSTEYFDCVPYGWALSDEASAILSNTFDGTQPPEFFRPVSEVRIMYEALECLERFELIPKGKYDTLSDEDLSAVYHTLSAEYPHLLSCTHAALGSGFEQIANPETEDEGTILQIHARDFLKNRHSFANCVNESGNLDLSANTENFFYSVYIEPLEALGSFSNRPVPMNWGAIVHERSSCTLSRVMSILTTASKIGQPVTFVRGLCDGIIGVRMKSAQPYVPSQNTSIRGGRHRRIYAEWMEERTTNIRGVAWIPIIVGSASTQLITLVRDAQDLIMTEILTSELDPSVFGPVNTPMLDPGHRMSVVGALIGEDYEDASLLCPYYNREGVMVYLNCDKDYVNSPVSPLYGLPSFLLPMPLRKGDNWNGVKLKVMRHPESCWDKPMLPMLALRDCTKKEDSWMLFPMPDFVNDVKLNAKSAIANYETLTQRGTAAPLIQSFRNEATGNGAAGATTDDNSSQGSSLQQAVAAAHAETPRRGRPVNIKVHIRNGPRHGVSVSASGRHVALERHGREITEVHKFGLHWMGNFAFCPPDKRREWCEALRLCTFAGKSDNAQAAVGFNIRSEWSRPLRNARVKQCNVRLPAVKLSTQQQEVLKNPYSSQTHVW